MRAVLCNGFDGTKALTVGEAPEPHPAPDEVLIDVHAASVSYMDYLMICGGYQMRPALPYVERAPDCSAAGCTSLFMVALARAPHQEEDNCVGGASQIHVGS